MNLSIETGAYGWRHQHWLHTLYPEDLPVTEPDDWRLSYYSNEFNVVVVPVRYWCCGQVPDCDAWCDAVHEDFRFIVECHSSMLEQQSEAELIHQLTALQPQILGFIIFDTESALDERLIKVMSAVDVEWFESVPIDEVAELKLWQHKSTSMSIAILAHELTDLRSARAITEALIQKQSLTEDGALALIINHPNLKAENLNKFRSVLEIMGY